MNQILHNIANGIGGWEYLKEIPLDVPKPIQWFLGGASSSKSTQPSKKRLRPSQSSHREFLKMPRPQTPIYIYKTYDTYMYICIHSYIICVYSVYRYMHVYIITYVYIYIYIYYLLYLISYRLYIISYRLYIIYYILYIIYYILYIIYYILYIILYIIYYILYILYIYMYIYYDYILHYTTQTPSKNYGAGLGDFGIHLTGDHIHRDEVKDNVHLEIRSHGLRKIGVNRAERTCRKELWDVEILDLSGFVWKCWEPLHPMVCLIIIPTKWL